MASKTGDTGPAESQGRDRSELVTATGWRVLGAAAEFVSDPQGLTARATLDPADILYSARFAVRPKSARADGADVVLSVLNAAISPLREDGEEPLGLDNALSESSGRFHGVHWDTASRGDRWAGELNWIHPHPVIAGVPLTTRAAVTRVRDRTELTVHVGAPGGKAAVRGYVGAGQARPHFLVELHRLARLMFAGGGPEIQTVDASAAASFVERILLAEKRTEPVAVLAPLEAADATEEAEYHVPPLQMAAELLGLARLWVIDRHTTTFRLTDTLGDKRLSCFFGALRIYMPGLSRADSGMDHPLLVHERVADPVERAGLVGELALALRSRIPVSFPIGELREPSGLPAMGPSEGMAPPAPAPDEAKDESAEVGGDLPPDGTGPILEALDGLTRTLASRLDTIAALQTELIDEVSRLRTATVVRSANTAGMERRLGEFERTLRALARKDGLDEETSVEPEPTERPEEEEEAGKDEDEFTLLSVLQGAASEYPESLLVLDSAFASAQESPFEDVLRVATNLKAMAELAHRRQEGRLGMSLRDAFGEAGVEYRGGISRSTSRRLRQQYEATLPNGQAIECHEHIVLGTSYDPRYCLRIYFTSRAPGEPRFVIAHLGRHFEVKTTT